MPPKKPVRRKSGAPAPKRAARKAVWKIPPAVRRIVEVLDEQKAEDIKVIPLDNHVADAFVLATVTSIRHLHSLADHVINHMREHGLRAHHVEGYGTSAPSSRWVLIDFLDVVVHLFTEEGRRFYDLDRLLEQ